MTPKEALDNLRITMRDVYQFPLNMTEEYEVLYDLVAKATPIIAEHELRVSSDGGVIHEEWYCRKCHHALYFDDNFCGKCGQAFIRSNEL